MRTKKGVKQLITGILIGEGLKLTDLEENAVDRIIEALIEENNLFIPDVSKQRELLFAFAEWKEYNGKWQNHDDQINDFLKEYKANNCS